MSAFGHTPCPPAAGSNGTDAESLHDVRDEDGLWAARTPQPARPRGGVVTRAHPRGVRRTSVGGLVLAVLPASAPVWASAPLLTPVGLGGPR